jgi:hypothetical protein
MFLILGSVINLFFFQVKIIRKILYSALLLFFFFKFIKLIWNVLKIYFLENFFFFFLVNFFLFSREEIK